MNEIQILNYHALSFIQNAIYCLVFAALIFITFRLVRVQQEKNGNIFAKILVSVFGLCTSFFGYSVFSYLRAFQNGQAYRFLELESKGVELSAMAKKSVEITGYNFEDGPPVLSIPEPAAIIFILTFIVMVLAGTWMNLSKE